MNWPTTDEGHPLGYERQRRELFGGVTYYNREQPNGYCQDLTPDRAKALYYCRRQRHPHAEEALK